MCQVVCQFKTQGIRAPEQAGYYRKAGKGFAYSFAPGVTSMVEEEKAGNLAKWHAVATQNDN